MCLAPAGNQTTIIRSSNCTDLRYPYSIYTVIATINIGRSWYIVKVMAPEFKIRPVRYHRSLLCPATAWRHSAQSTVTRCPSCQSSTPVSQTNFRMEFRNLISTSLSFCSLMECGDNVYLGTAPTKDRTVHLPGNRWSSGWMTIGTGKPTCSERTVLVPFCSSGVQPYILHWIFGKRTRSSVMKTGQLTAWA